MRPIIGFDLVRSSWSGICYSIPWCNRSWLKYDYLISALYCNIPFLPDIKAPPVLSSHRRAFFSCLLLGLSSNWLSFIPSSTLDDIAGPLPNAQVGFLRSPPNRQSYERVWGCDDTPAPIDWVDSSRTASSSDLRAAAGKIALLRRHAYRHCR